MKWDVLLELSKMLKSFEISNDIDRKRFRSLLCEIEEEYCDIIDELRDGFKLMMIGDRYSIFTRKLRMQLKAVFGRSIYIFSYNYNDLQKYANLTVSNLYDDDFLDFECHINKYSFINCIRTAARFRNLINLLKPSIIHVHYLKSYYFCFYIGYILAKVNPGVITTIWGSDMYKEATSSARRKFFQSFWLKQADLISVANSDVAKDFIRIYGGKYNKKLRYTAFGLPTDIIYQDHYVTDKYVEEFAKKYSIPDDKIKIIISSSADPHEGHKYIVKELMNLPKDIKKKLFLLIPMTYGDLYYREKFGRFLKDSKVDMDYIMFREYMSDADIIALRKVADIVIFLPLTDAFSAFLQESLYLGNVVITGSWLPYSWIEENGIYAYKLKEKYKDGELSNIIENILSNLEKEKDLSMKNKDRMVKMVSWQYNLKGWLKLYREVLK